MRTALFFVAVLGALGPNVAVSCDGCGCRGGPGYRGPDGHCVGWAKLNKICGNPPTRCSYEALGAALAIVPALPDKSASPVNKGAMVPDLSRAKPSDPTPPITSNVQQAIADGIGCIDEATIQTVSTCETARSAKDCEQQRAELIGSKTRYSITAGTTGAIEAGSHSFDWLRVRIPGATQPLWTPRGLFLNN